MLMVAPWKVLMVNGSVVRLHSMMLSSETAAILPVSASNLFKKDVHSMNTTIDKLAAQEVSSDSEKTT
jgi:hypothetical protein